MIYDARKLDRLQVVWKRAEDRAPFFKVEEKRDSYACPFRFTVFFDAMVIATSSSASLLNGAIFSGVTVPAVSNNSSQ